MFIPHALRFKMPVLSTIRSHYLGLATGAFLALSSTSLWAQNTDQPLDLTILSTSENDVQFIITETAPRTDNLTEVDAQTAQDNASFLAEDVADGVAEEVTEGVAEEVPEEVTEEVTEAPSNEGASGRMTRRNIKDVGLASIGIAADATHNLDALDNRLWRGVPLARAMRLINGVPEVIASDALRKMSYHVVARQAVPPKGAAEMPSALLAARMDYLSRIGRSHGLADIITQLPQSDEWQEWHLWKLFYDLMMREDEKPCLRAAEEATTSLDPLWQRTNLLCQILTGDAMRAAFSADVLKASGLIDDALYFELVDVLLGRKEAEAITPDMMNDAKIDILHVILMDAAHVNIGAAQLAALDNSYGEAANHLRYLADDARQSLGMGNLRAGLMNIDEANAVFIASSPRDETPLMALSRRLEAAPQEADSAAVRLYLSLRTAVQNLANTTPSEAQIEELIATLLNAISTEVQAGDGAIFVPLYAPYLSDAMAVADMRALDASIQSDYAAVMALAGLPLSPLPVDGGAVVQGDHMSIAGDNSAPVAERVASLLRLDSAALLPLVTGASAAEQDWLDVFETALMAENKDAVFAYQPLSQSGLLALAGAAEKGQRAEAIIIAAKLVSDRALNKISPADHAQIIAYLAQANVPLAANAYAKDAFSAHIIAANLGKIGDNTP